MGRIGESMSKRKKRIFEIIQIGNRADAISLSFDIFIVAVILLNIFVTFFLTFEQAQPYQKVLRSIEFVTILIFMAEYCLRLWTAEFLYPEQTHFLARISFIRSFYGIVDLVTILSFFLPVLFPGGAVAFRMLRVVRILHLFRINARYDAFNIITEVLREKRNQLVSSIFMVLVLMLASSLCMYGLEHDAQPEHFTNAFSGIWWSVSTLLTVGYGDIYPITAGGRIMAIVIAFLGVGMVAIPTGIISAGFVEYYSRAKNGIQQRFNADFITLDVTDGHPYDGKRMRDISIPEGLYVAAVLREGYLHLTKSDFVFRDGDCLLLGTHSVHRMEDSMEEEILTAGHSWIGKRIRDLDISRQAYVLMIRRGEHVIIPKGDTLLEKNDKVLMLIRNVGSYSRHKR